MYAPGVVQKSAGNSLCPLYKVPPGGDGYISLNSEGLPYHSQLGLLHAALEEQNTTILLGALKDSGHGRE